MSSLHIERKACPYPLVLIFTIFRVKSLLVLEIERIVGDYILSEVFFPTTLFSRWLPYSPKNNNIVIILTACRRAVTGYVSSRFIIWGTYSVLCRANQFVFVNPTSFQLFAIDYFQIKAKYMQNFQSIFYLGFKKFLMLKKKDTVTWLRRINLYYWVH